MDNQHENHILDNVLLLLDIFVIIQVEENPVIGIVLLGLLKTVTRDRLIRILFILLIITLSEVL
ncbi:hypothetical protein [Metabacillus fastidiosus]|uniref:hypothetical protein n=1 Tax=Metabacillus fastidiosus TaxID=1458 RepID=UPI002DBCD1A9|nr:hypothetical protein [Metabacillus fastidiosus]MEC2074590.1 hypothetical protein [Metabacillus fastidiosus]